MLSVLLGRTGLAGRRLTCLRACVWAWFRDHACRLHSAAAAAAAAFVARPTGETFVSVKRNHSHEGLGVHSRLYWGFGEIKEVFIAKTQTLS